MANVYTVQHKSSVLAAVDGSHLTMHQTIGQMN